ncbi:MAG TPA: phosphate regulon sensor histidine kinase PhoR [Dokdonella sp.]|uniref:phosphate regulon sensor histidine kinase PhoR n=1 Tax=Dokdonella sp. TaxID=2291710 RepID=UPI002D7EBC17|nr:phosphate regulon sensor histidine kinase PhoR [Dokdonella sp.]HET9032220.1 phosphate regulon sensor histidine kinase PhoR [Dokdonella sp.]
MSRHGGARRRQLLDKLRAFQAAAMALPDALVAVDADHRIRWFNTAAGQMLGLQHPADVERLVGEAIAIPGLTDWIASGAADPLPDVAAPGNPELSLSLRLISYAEDHAVLLARDVSQLLRLEKMRRDFVANVSHELRTPLTVVHGYLDLIEPEQIPEYESIIRELRSQSRRMTQIVEDLLTLSRLDAEETLPKARVVMRALVSTLKRDAEGLSQGRHDIDISIEGRHDLRGSSRDLYSAFSNLVSNAVRYTPVGGSIRIIWSSSETTARLRVIDSGHGISAEHIPRLTERFYRVSTSRSRESGGTGLGLSIVKHVLQLHDAHLEIQSEVGKGSTFSCIFAGNRLLQPEHDPEET